MPDALDTQGTLDEIAYALDVLKADGVTLYTRYGKGNCYLGNERLAPIWKELNKRKAVVFIHPTHPKDTDRVNPFILQPTIDYPHETTRAVYDLILSNTKRDNPDCKIILPHAGGTLPWIFPRSTTLLRGLPSDRMPLHGKTYEDVWADFRSFYFDIALSQSHEGLDLLLKRVPEDHILYGESKTGLKRPTITPLWKQNRVANFRRFRIRLPVCAAHFHLKLSRRSGNVHNV